jgi:hypothetical protein
MPIQSRIICAAVLLALGACADGGVRTVGQDTYLVVKRSAPVGFGPPAAATAYVYDTANDYCVARGRTVETIRLDQVDSAIGKPSRTSLRFRCVFAVAPQ